MPASACSALQALYLSSEISRITPTFLVILDDLCFDESVHSSRDLEFSGPNVLPKSVSLGEEDRLGDPLFGLCSFVWTASGVDGARLFDHRDPVSPSSGVW